MSADDEKATILEEKLKDITDCCICLETYKEPKILPCIHTFCLNCLEGVGTKTNRCPSDSMPCPICRKEFTIPAEGFAGLQKNFFMERLVEIGKVINPSGDRTECDLCSEDVEAGSSSEIPSAETYCADCHQKLCQECNRHHRKSKLSKNHKIIALEDQTIQERCIGAALPTFCDQHNNKPLEIYCSDCQETVCSICFFDIHKTHNGLHINNIVDDFREKIRKNKEDFPSRVNSLIERRKTLENDTAEFLQNTKEIESEINCARVELKHLVDGHSESLLKQLTSLKLEKLKYTEIQKDEIDILVASLESYESYCNQLTVMGSASDICRAAYSLDKRADELNHIYKATEQIGMHIKHNVISLRKAEVLEPDKENVIGHIEEADTELCSQTEAHSEPADCEALTSISIVEEPSRNSGNSVNGLDESEDLKTTEQLMMKVQELEQQLELLKQEQMERERVEEVLRNYKPVPRRISGIPPTMVSTGSNMSWTTVTGLTVLDKELFISVKGRSDIEVYDSTRYNFKRLFRVAELTDPWDICSCCRNKFLYIASGFSYQDQWRFSVTYSVDFNENRKKTVGRILKVDVDGRLVSYWNIGIYYGTLSITREGNVVLSIPAESKIVEYGADGKCLREINMTIASNLKMLSLSDKSDLNYTIRPIHAKKLRSGNFLVIFFICNKDDHSVSSKIYSNRSGLCVINSEGGMSTVISGDPGDEMRGLNDFFGYGELLEPWYLAVDKEMAVLVLERSSKRISLLSPNLKNKRNIVSHEHGLSNPYRIYFDETNLRLLVANSDSQQDHFLAYEIKKP